MSPSFPPLQDSSAGLSSDRVVRNAFKWQPSYKRHILTGPFSSVVFNSHCFTSSPHPTVPPACAPATIRRRPLSHPSRSEFRVRAADLSANWAAAQKNWGRKRPLRPLWCPESVWQSVYNILNTWRSRHSCEKQVSQKKNKKVLFFLWRHTYSNYTMKQTSSNGRLYSRSGNFPPPHHHHGQECWSVLPPRPMNR